MNNVFRERRLKRCPGNVSLVFVDCLCWRKSPITVLSSRKSEGKTVIALLLVCQPLMSPILFFCLFVSQTIVKECPV